MALIRRELAPSIEGAPKVGTVMCYGTDYASTTLWEWVPPPKESTMINFDGSTYQHTSYFGRLVRMRRKRWWHLAKRICEIDTTVDAEKERERCRLTKRREKL